MFAHPFHYIVCSFSLHIKLRHHALLRDVILAEAREVPSIYLQRRLLDNGVQP